MPGNKYLASNNGTLTEVAASQTSAGAADANKIVALDASGRLDVTMMPTGVGPDTSPLQASEALSAGDFVNVWNSSGAFRVRKADASAVGKEANGFVLAAVASGANAVVYFEGRNTALAGVSPAMQYLSATTPGGFTATPPSGTGQVVQRLGVGVNATEINFEAQQPIVLA